MTISSEITKLINNLSACYTRCNDKGATIPQDENFDNLANCINSIPTANLTSLSVTPSTTAQTLTPSSPYNGFNQVDVSAVTSSIDANITAGNIKKDVQILGVTGTYEGSGGGDSGGEYHICVFDDYGNILKQDHLDSGEIFTMPTPPARTGLEFIKWVGGADVVNNTITMPDYDVFMAPLYTTNSKRAEAKIAIYRDNYTLNLQEYPYDTGFMCDWGDGSASEDLSSAHSHTYQTAGIYTITINAETAFNSAHVSFTQYDGTPIEFLEVNNTNYGSTSDPNQACIRISISPVYNPNCIYRPAEDSEGACIFANRLSILQGQPSQYPTVALLAYAPKSLVIDKNANFQYDAYEPISNVNYVTFMSTLNTLGACNSKITMLSTVVGTYTAGTKQLNTYYLKNIISVPAITDNSNSLAYCTNRDTFYVPFNLWYSFKKHSIWSNEKQIVITKTPVTVNPTISQGATLSVFGKNITGQFVNYGDKFDFIYNDGTTSYNGTYENLQPNSTVNVNFSTLNYKFVTIDCGVSGLNITSKVEFVDGNDGTYTAAVYLADTSLAYFIDGGASYMDYSGTIDLTQQSPIIETINLTPATEASFTQPTLSSNGTIGGNSFAVKAQSIQSNYVWRAFDNNDSTTWGQNSTSFVTYNSPVLMIYNPEKIKISQIVFHTTATTATYPQSSTSANGRKWQASNDGETWITLDTTSENDSSVPADRVVTFNNNNNFYKYYRYTFVQPTSGSTYTQMVNTNKQIDITATYKVAAI